LPWPPGLSGALSSTRLVVTAGIAEIVAGSISMGLGGYLAARSERDHYQAELAREGREVDQVPDQEAEEASLVLTGYGLGPKEAAPVVKALRMDKSRWVGFMMRFELGLEEPDPSRIVEERSHHRLGVRVRRSHSPDPYMLATKVQTASLFPLRSLSWPSSSSLCQEPDHRPAAFAGRGANHLDRRAGGWAAFGIARLVS